LGAPAPQSLYSPTALSTEDLSATQAPAPPKCIYPHCSIYLNPRGIGAFPPLNPSAWNTASLPKPPPLVRATTPPASIAFRDHATQHPLEHRRTAPMSFRAGRAASPTARPPAVVCRQRGEPPPHPVGVVSNGNRLRRPCRGSWVCLAVNGRGLRRGRVGTRWAQGRREGAARTAAPPRPCGGGAAGALLRRARKERAGPRRGGQVGGRAAGADPARSGGRSACACAGGCGLPTGATPTSARPRARAPFPEFWLRHPRAFRPRNRASPRPRAQRRPPPGLRPAEAAAAARLGLGGG
jgi:hypothetical protein